MKVVQSAVSTKVTKHKTKAKNLIFETWLDGHGSMKRREGGRGHPEQPERHPDTTRASKM